MSYSKLLETGAFPTFAHYNFSLSEMLMTVYPEYDWYPQRFPSPLRTVVKDPEFMKVFVNFIEQSLELKEPLDWYSVTKEKLDQLGVFDIIRRKGGLYPILKEYRPDVEWDSSRFKWAPILFNGNSMGALIDFVEKELKIKTPEEWYTISNDRLIRLGVFWFFRKNGYLYKCLKAFRPTYKWVPWRFQKIPKGLTSDSETLKTALDYVEFRLNITKPEDWYKVRKTQLNDLGVYEVFYRNGYLYPVLKKFRPSFDWVPWKFTRLPKGITTDAESIDRALTYVETELGIDKLEDWYKVSYTDLVDLGVYWFFFKNGYIFKVLRDHRPGINWEPWRFQKLPKGASVDPDSIRAALSYIEKSLGMVQAEDWYRVSRVQLKSLGVRSIIANNGGLFAILKKYRPDYSWDSSKFLSWKQTPEPLSQTFPDGPRP